MEMLLTVEQTAERLQLAPFTVREHLKSGKLRGIKRGRVWRVPESALTEETQILNEKEDVNPLEQALKLIAKLEKEVRHKPKRILGVNDVATEIRQMREERTP
jgi:excisionase family DNA binding protein